jgi:hypothetical protein
MKRCFCAIVILLLVTQVAYARQWKTANGKYKVTGDLVAFNDDHVVIQKANKDKDLISIKMDELSKEDQEFLKSKESEELLKSEAERLHTWTFKGGLKVTARVVDYVKKDAVIGKRRGKIYVNDRAYKSLPEVYQKIVQRVIEHYEKITVENEKDIEKWLEKRGNKDAKYACDGVILELENGDEYAVPIFLFSEKDQYVLTPGWERWAQYKDDEKKSDHERLLLEAQTRAYQQTQQQTQIQQLQLGLLVSQAGLVWEVCLVPPQGVVGYPQCVVVPAANSAQASAQALVRFPGYTVAAARRVE